MGNITISANKTLIGKAVALNRVVSNFVFQLVFALIWVLGIGATLYLVYAVAIAAINTEEAASPVFLGYAYIFVGILIAYFPVRSYYKQKVCYPKIIDLAVAKEMVTKNEPFNIFAVFSFELARVTAGLMGRKTAQITSKDLALALLKSNSINFVLVRLDIGKEKLMQALNAGNGGVEVQAVILQSLDIAIAEGHHQIEVGDVFVALCQSDPTVKSTISQLKLEVTDVANVVYWQTSILRKHLEGRRFLDPAGFKFTGGIGRDWAYGFTPLLRQYGHDLTEAIQTRGLGLEVIGREKEIEQIEEALMRQRNGGVVLVGEAGIGKRTTVLGLARKIATGATKGNLAYKHLFELDIESLLAGYAGSGDVLERLKQLFYEIARSGNSIVFIENIGNLLSDDGAGKVNAAEILISFLEIPGISVIGTIDVNAYNQLIAPNSSLTSHFNRVTVDEPNDVETIRILEDVVPVIEGRTGSVVSYEAIKETVKKANKFIFDIPNPERSINLLDGAAAHATGERHETIILPEDIMNYLEIKYEIPTGQVGEAEKQKLLTLEDEMHQSVIGQDQAIKAIAGAMRRARAGVEETKKPIGSFLFLGPTGVGKTETAKALAKAYFGGVDKMIRFDMSEYQNAEDIYRLIGSNFHGEISQGTLTTAIREHPFSLVLFDEIEKADPRILDLFLQILDEGHLTDGGGRKVSFTNSIIICTSNAGANLIREAIQTGEDYEKTKVALLNYLQKENIYRPEFLNRFTSVVAFAPLSPAEIGKVATLMINKVKETVMRTRGVSVEIAPEAVIELVSLGYSPEMGARPMARVIEEKVEDLLAKKILAGELKEGDSIVIGKEDIR